MNLSIIKSVVFIVVLLIATSQKIYPQSGSLSSTNTRNIPFNFYGYNGASLITINENLLGGSYSGTGWAGVGLLGSMANSSFYELRYPAGTVANNWDWYEGWFIPNNKMPDGYRLLTRYENYSVKDCKIPTFANAVKTAAVTPIFDPNLMTSDKYYQGAMLYRARALNLSVQNIEMGNEFYNDHKSFAFKYPLTDHYITDANTYASFVSTHFPTGTTNPFIKSAVVGAVSTDNLPNFSRRNTWLNALVNNTISITSEAITLHNYIPTGLATDKLEMDGTNLHVIFHTALSNMITSEGAMNRALNTIQSSTNNNNKEIWVTEYNFQDGAHLMAGTWAHGLFTITMALSYLENLFSGDPFITKVDCHDLVETASSAGMFADAHGFHLGNADESYYKDPADDPGFTGSIDCSTDDWQQKVITSPYGLSACGITLKILGDATKGATTATKIDFSGISSYQISDIEGANALDGLYGWFFDKPNTYTAIILNLTNLDIASFDAATNIFNSVSTTGIYLADAYFPGESLSVHQAYDNSPGAACSLANLASNSEIIPGVLNAVTGIYASGGYTDYATYQSRNISQYSQTSVYDVSALPLNAYSITVITASKSATPVLNLYCDLADPANLTYPIQVCAGSDFYIRADGISPFSWSSSSTDITTTNANGDKVLITAIPTANGNYTVTCTDNTPTTTTISVRVNAPVTVQFTNAAHNILPPVPPLTGGGIYHPCIDASGNFDISAVFGPGTSSNYSAIWFDSDKKGLDDITGSAWNDYPTISLVADKPDKVYYIVATDGLCYSGFDSVEVQPYNFLQLPPDYYKCAGTGNDITVIADIPHKDPHASYSYAWSGGLSSVYNPTVSAGTTTVYTVTVTVTNAGTYTDACTGTYTASTTVHVEPHCTCTVPTGASDKYVPPGSNTDDIYTDCGYSSYTPGTTHIYQKNIYVKGHVFIDQNIYFEECNLYFDRDASITIVKNLNPAKTETKLTFDHCVLDACGTDNWNGIILEDPGAFLVMKSGTATTGELKHAETGITVLNDARVELHEMIFADNHRHLHFSDFLNEAECEIYGCTFTSNSGTMFTYSHTENAIEIDDVEDVTIGVPGQAENTFENYVHGIDIYNSSCQLYNNNFQGTTSGSITGVKHVYGSNDAASGSLWPEYKLTVGSTATGAGNSFFTNVYQVYVINMNTVIMNNAFIDASYAILSRTSGYKDINIRNNDFENVQKAIELVSVGNGNITIQNNTIITDNTGSYPTGILVSADNLVTDNAAHLTIKNNTDTCGTYGIYLENLDMGTTVSTHDTWVGVNNNSIVFPVSYNTMYGIRTENCDNMRITENEVGGILSDPYYVTTSKTAISLSQTTNSLVACNTTDAAETGLQFENDCSGAEIKANEMKYHDDGFTLVTSGVIGDQPISGGTEAPQNKYTGPFGTADLHTYNSYGGAYQFKYKNATGYIPAVSIPTGSGTAISPSIGFSFTTDFNCGNLQLRQANSNGGGKKLSDLVIVHNGLNKLSPQNTDSNLFKILKCQILNDGSIEDATNYSQMVYAFEKFRKDTALKSSDSTFTAWYDSVRLGNIGKFSIIKQLMYLVTDTSQIHNDSALVAYYLDSANTINQNIVPVLIVEANKKGVNDLYIHKIVKHIFNFYYNEKLGIHGIAEQCPFSGGTAVIEARTIEKHWNDTLNYNNDLLCFEALQISQKHSKDEIKEQVELNVYPNPTNNSIKIQSNVNGVVSLKDMTGRKIFEVVFTSPLKEIYVAGILPGVYFLILEVNNIIVANKQIVLIK